ncbi:MAG: lytic transglycosylase domain-containing protein [Flavobacteriales bacterium]|nr:lytic transglycosylase domain-containing protein [Flavobacteriales bacterium]
MEQEMMQIKKELHRMRLALTILSFILIAIGLVLVFLLFQGKTIHTHAESVTEIPSIPTAEISANNSIPLIRFDFLSLPDSISLAGEAVPLTQHDIRERFEFEMLITVYKNATTILAFKRSKRWFPVIESILESEGVPDDFKYLCVIESNLSNAISPSNAVGFWQFLEGTGKQYGLEINEDVDERYDVEKSTRAACKYLKDAYKKFGSWTLAAASYNMGMSGLEKQIEEQQESSYYDLRLNQETARYVFRMAATKELFMNPQKYGYTFTSDQLYTAPEVNYIEVNSSIPNLVEFAKSNGTTYKMLKELNPWLRSKQLRNASGKKYRLVIPAHK